MIALRWIRIERPLDDDRTGGGEVGTPLRDRNSLDAFVRGAELRQRPGADREGTRKQVIQHDATCVDVARHRGRVAFEQFGREIQRGAGQPVACGVAQLATGPEVHEHDPPVTGDHHVLRFDVPVQQSGLVNGGHCGTELAADRQRLRLGELPSVTDRLFERLAVDEFHPQAHAIADPLSAVNRGDVGMAHASQETPFFDDGRGSGFVCGGCGRQELQGHFPVEPCVPGAIDLSESATSDWLENTKGTPLPEPGVFFERTAVHIGNRGQHPKLLEQRPIGIAGTRIGQLPVDWGTVQNRPSQFVNGFFSRHHGGVLRQARVSARRAGVHPY